MPTVTVVSSVFEAMARAEARGLGLADLAILVVPHPVHSRPEAELRDLGAGLSGQCIAALVGGANP